MLLQLVNINTLDMGLVFIQKKPFCIVIKKTQARNVMIFGCNLSDSAHDNNRKNKVLVLGENDVEIGKTTIHAEQLLLKKFTVSDKTFVLSLYYNENNSYLFINKEKIAKFKSKTLEIVPNAFCLGNLSSDHTSGESLRTGMTGYTYYAALDYQAKTINEIQNIHTYLMKKNNIV